MIMNITWQTVKIYNEDSMGIKFVIQNNINNVRNCLLLLLMLCASSTALAQDEAETAKPLMDMEVVRKMSILDVEGKFYDDVTISLKSITPDYFIYDQYRVKVKAVDSNGATIYKKTLKGVYLYVFKNGQVQVGKRNFDQIVIQKSSRTGDYIGIIREKEGVY